MSGTTKGLQLRSLIKKSGELELSLAEVPIPEPGPDQVLVKVEATPINPSDLGLRLGPADLLQERRQEPAADAPRHAVVARQLDGAGVEAAVDVDLLVRG